MYGWYEIPGALVRLLEADLAAGEFFEHLSDEQRGMLLGGGGTGADYGALLERAGRGYDAAEF